MDSAVLDRALELCQAARGEHLNVTPARVLDALRALPQIDWTRPDDVRIALRTNLAGSREDEIRFDRLFREFFFQDAPQAHPSRIRGESMQGRLGHHYREINQDITTAAESFSADTVHRALDLETRWNVDAKPIAQLIRELARKLATRPSRRTRVVSHGRAIDLRRSVRRNIGKGMDFLELAHVERRTRKTRLVMLCDVSGSMDAFNPFLLQLMFGLQQALRNSRTLVFSTYVTEITALLKQRSVTEALHRVSETVRDWSGGTDIGGALAALNRGALREGAPGKTVVIVISDGYDNGNTALIADEMQALRRRARQVVWINPMYGASTFQVRAAGMRAALPYVDHFLPAFDARSLEILVHELGKIWH